MVDKRLIDYVHKTLSSGYSASQVREALLKKGWKQEDVDEAMLAVSPMVSAKSRPLKKVSKKIPQQESRKTPKKPVRDFFSSFKKSASKNIGLSVSPEEKVVASSKETKKQETRPEEQKEQKNLMPKETKKNYAQDLVKGISQKSMFETNSSNKNISSKKITENKTKEKDNDKEKGSSEEDIFKEFNFEDNKQEKNKQEKNKQEKNKQEEDSEDKEGIKYKENNKEKDKVKNKDFNEKKSQQKHSDKKDSLLGLKITLAVLIILFLAVLGVGIWYFFFYSGPPIF